MDPSDSDEPQSPENIRQQIHRLYFRIVGFFFILSNDVSSAARELMARTISENNVVHQICDCPLDADVRCKPNCSNRRRWVECPPGCPRCRNMRIRNGLFARVKMQCTCNGLYGVFSQQIIGQGDLVIEFVGQVLHGREVTDQLLVQIPHVDIYIDAERYSNESRAIRVDAAMANCSRQIWTVDLEYRVVYVATRRIRVGEEIIYDGTTYHNCYLHERGTCVDGTPGRSITMREVSGQPGVYEGIQRQGPCSQNMAFQMREDQLAAFRNDYNRAVRLQRQLDQQQDEANVRRPRSPARPQFETCEQFNNTIPHERSINDVNSPFPLQHENVTIRRRLPPAPCSPASPSGRSTGSGCSGSTRVSPRDTQPCAPRRPCRLSESTSSPNEEEVNRILTAIDQVGNFPSARLSPGQAQNNSPHQQPPRMLDFGTEGTSQGLTHDPTQPLPINTTMQGGTVLQVPMANGGVLQCTIPDLSQFGAAAALPDNNEAGSDFNPPEDQGQIHDENLGISLTEQLLDECGYNDECVPSLVLEGQGNRYGLRCGAEVNPCEAVQLGDETHAANSRTTRNLETINAVDLNDLGLGAAGLTHDRVEEAVEVAASTGAAAVEAGVDVDVAAGLGAVAGNAVINHRQHFVCSLCGRHLESEEEKLAHEEKCLDNPGGLRCPYQCGKTLKTGITLNRHKRTCPNKPNEQEPQPGTSGQSTVRSGIRQAPPAQTSTSAIRQIIPPCPPVRPAAQNIRAPHQAPAVNRQLVPPPAVTNPIRQVAQPLKPFKCAYEDCNVRFSWEKSKKAHEKTCLKKPGGQTSAFKCPSCGKEYQEKKSLLNHRCMALRLALINKDDELAAMRKAACRNEEQQMEPEREEEDTDSDQEQQPLSGQKRGRRDRDNQDQDSSKRSKKGC